MMPSRQPPENKPVPYAALGGKALTVGSKVGCLTLIIVLASLFGGLWLDNVLGTKPLLTLFLVVASAPLSLVITFWVARRELKDMTLPNAGSGKTISTEGEKTGE